VAKSSISRETLLVRQGQGQGEGKYNFDQEVMVAKDAK